MAMGGVSRSVEPQEMFQGGFHRFDTVPRIEFLAATLGLCVFALDLLTPLGTGAATFSMSSPSSFLLPGLSPKLPSRCAYLPWYVPRPLFSRQQAGTRHRHPGVRCVGHMVCDVDYGAAQRVRAG